MGGIEELIEKIIINPYTLKNIFTNEININFPFWIKCGSSLEMSYLSKRGIIDFTDKGIICINSGYFTITLPDGGYFSHKNKKYMPKNKGKYILSEEFPLSEKRSTSGYRLKIVKNEIVSEDTVYWEKINIKNPEGLLLHLSCKYFPCNKIQIFDIGIKEVQELFLIEKRKIQYYKSMIENIISL